MDVSKVTENTFFEKDTLSSKDWQVLFSTTNALFDMGFINEFTLSPFVKGLKQSIKGISGANEKLFETLDAKQASKVFKELQKDTSKTAQLLVASPIGFLFLLVLSVEIFKYKKMLDGTKPSLNPIECLELLIVDIRKKIIKDNGEFFRSKEIRNHFYRFVSNAFDPKKTDFIEKILINSEGLDDCLSLDLQKTNYLLALFLGGVYAKDGSETWPFNSEEIKKEPQDPSSFTKIKKIILDFFVKKNAKED